MYDSHVADLLDREGTYLYVDVGGGSTEISLIADGKLVDSHSFDIGTVRQLTGTVRPDDWQGARPRTESVGRSLRELADHRLGRKHQQTVPHGPRLA